MKPFGVAQWAAVVLMLFVVQGCGTPDTVVAAGAETQAAVMGLEECAACGMVVREQPAPRAQLQHRDGARMWFCSIGDLIAYMKSPSPHGHIQQVYVEALAQDADPAHLEMTAKPWVPAEAAVYVVGIKREGVMGEAVMTYQAGPDPTALSLGGKQQSWQQITE